MRYILIAFVFILMSCDSKEETLTMADLKEGDKAQIVAIEIQEEHLVDSALHNRLLSRIGAKVGVIGVARGPKQAQRGISYGFDPEGGAYFGLYEPQASMIKVKRLE